MTKPAVSVCIPVYNGAEFIAMAVESVLSQTFQDFELIICDNASTDETPRILEQFTDRRLRIIRHASNIGATANFNAVLREARGEWVKLLCADDLIYPDCLEKQLQQAAVSTGDPFVLLCCARDIIDATGRRWMQRGFTGRSGRVSSADALRHSVKSGTNLLGEPGGVLMRRDALERAGGFDPDWRFSMDIDLWARILQYGDLFVESSALCAFRISEQACSRVMVRSQAKEFCRWMKRRQQEGLLKLSYVEFQMGYWRAHLLMMQRWVFYKLLRILKGKSKGESSGLVVGNSKTVKVE